MSISLAVFLTTTACSFNNVSALVGDQMEDNIQLLNSSKNFIINLFDQVNNLSNSYQNTLENENQSFNNNLTRANETDEYIDNLKRIIADAKEYNLQEEYKPVFNNYINSLQNEINSYTHYKNYLLTGNNTENTISMDLLSKAYEFETEAIKDFNELQ
jgi:ABC-type transporter Mla subunit MlaD